MLRRPHLPLIALSLSLASLAAAQGQAPGTPPGQAPGTPLGQIPGAPPGPSPERLALEKLSTENAIEREKQAQRLRQLTEERDEAALKYQLAQEKLKAELADLEAQQRKLSVENALEDEKTKARRRELEGLAAENMFEKEKVAKKLRGLGAERDELSLTNALQQEKLRAELADKESQQRKMGLDNALFDEKARKDLAETRYQRDKVQLEADLERAKIQLQLAKQELEKSEIEIEARRIDLKSRKLKFEAEEIEAKTTVLRTDLDLRVKKEDWKSETNRDPEYLKEPFKDGVLTITDRKIPLNGPIVRGVADFVSERIHFFNNKSEELPIFIVIDRSPGGSVMEGYRIVKAMKASKAPVYVVVRSFAASMAAVITALAPKSYAYPNAVILHHQMSSFMWGNMTQMKEQLQIAEEWYRRLGTPVAEKMGTDLSGFTKGMYSHNSDGDWEEFADRAKKLRWVDDLVHEIRETGIMKDPNKNPVVAKSFFEWHEERDSKGEPFVRLPRLEPFDLYYLYNRDNYYR